MNEEKFNELIKTINDNIHMFSYFMMPDGKLRLIAETTDGEKHYVKVWDNIQTHDAVIEKRIKEANGHNN